MRRHAKLLVGVLTLLGCLGAVLVGAASAVAPVVTPPTATNVRYTTAHLEGEVNPEDHETFFHFEYATQGQFEASEWGEASFAGFGSYPEGAGSQPVEVDLGGLQPATVYHFRLVAENTEAEHVQAAAASTFETEAVAKPTVSIDEVSTFTATTAHFAGHVNPNAPEAAPVSDPAVEAAFESHWHFQCVAPGPTECPGLSGGTVPAGESAQEVSADATSLQPNTAYYVKLVAENIGGGEEDQTAASPSFTTPAVGPEVATGTNTPEGQGKVLVRGYVNPRNDEVTSCEFLYGLTESYGQTVPCEGDPGSGGVPVEVTAELSGLEAGKTFHFAVVATNGAGTEESDDGVFATLQAPEPEAACPNEALREEQHSTFLPDCRAYEMVSPTDKNGSDIAGDPTKTRAAAAGNALAFTSLGAFGDVRGTGLVTPYLSKRDATPGTGGWSTHAIAPLQGPASFIEVGNGVLPNYFGEFAPDLSKGVLITAWPLTAAPNVAGVGNVYLRTDLLTPGPGNFQLVSDAVAPVGFNSLASLAPRPAGASADFSHVIFESVEKLTADGPAEGSGSVYEWNNGAVRLAGVLPDGTPAPESVAGRGIGLTTPMDLPRNMISRDGSRVFFTVPVSPGDSSGDVYMRVDHTSTVQLNASEKTVPDSPRPATYRWATPDGTQVFFSTSEALTDDDVTGNDLYRYDVNAPANAHLTLISVDNQPVDDNLGHDIESVIGGSDDGRYIYFVSHHQLVAGAPRILGGGGIYLWHDGKVSFVGAVSDDTDIGPMNGRAWAADPPTARVSPDGRSLLFVSKSGVGLDGADHGSCENVGSNGCKEVYLYQADHSALSCISCPAGTATADATPVSFVSTGADSHSNHLNHPLSDDGARVLFTSGDALVSEDTNGARDAYVYDIPSGAIHLISSGVNPSDSLFLDASNSGNDVFFATRDRLSGWDNDQNLDVYDARVGGGFPEPAPSVSCLGETCRPGGGTPPAPTAGSATLSVPGNSKACHRGQVRRHGRCVKSRRHHRRGAHHKRHAGNDRRAGR